MFSRQTSSWKSSLDVQNAWHVNPAIASPRSRSSVATAAPLEKSTIEWAEAKRIFRAGSDRMAETLDAVQVCEGGWIIAFVVRMKRRREKGSFPRVQDNDRAYETGTAGDSGFQS